MPRHSLLIMRFPYGGREDAECVDWLIQTYHKAELDRRFDRVAVDHINDTPITMTRNQALNNAVRLGFDFVLMVDSDMAPDCELRAGDPTAVPFFDCAVEYALKSPKPCVIAAPYVGPPPLENIYVFQWANRGNTLHPDASRARLDQFTREQAAQMAGIQEVGALPTGLMLLDVRALAKLPQPWTYYEYHKAGEECVACHQRARGPETHKASTEDVTFTRDLGLLGVPILCAWSSWAGHNKRYTARKPRPYTVDVVSNRFRDAILGGRHSAEEQIEVQPPDWLAAHEAEMAKKADGAAQAVPTHTGWQELTGYDPTRPSPFAGIADEAAAAAGQVLQYGGEVAARPPAQPLGVLDQTGKIDYEAFFRPERGVVVRNETSPPLVGGPGHEIRLTPVFEESAGPRPPVEGYSRPWEENIPPAAAGPERPWDQHVPPAATAPLGEPLTPADLLSGVPLG